MIRLLPQRVIAPWLIGAFSLLPAQVSAETIIRATQVATGLSRPLYATAPIHDHRREFIVEQHTGNIKILDLTTGQILPQPFLTIPGVSTTNEQGLLGLAFDTFFDTSGKFYVNYTDSSGTTNVVEYRVSATNPNVADASSARKILTVPQPQANHNGGWIAFSPQDTYLYVSLGDGGSANDTGAGHTEPNGNGQDITNNLLGKMLRIDPRRDDFPNDAARNYGIPANNPFVNKTGDDEIWAYGLRNAWRNSFDRATGDFYIADVGQDNFEEINYQPAVSQGGENYGWRLREGASATPGVGGNKPTGAVDPIYAYSHQRTATGGVSVTGGYVYRGNAVPELQGNYLFADFGSNQIWSFKNVNGQLTEFRNRTEQIVPDVGQLFAISSFGEDADGNLYVLSIGGQVYRLDESVAATPLLQTGDVWKYSDTGADLGTDWRNINYNDALWKSGPSQLGYGDGDEATVIKSGPNAASRYPTAYFRREFDITNPNDIEELVLGLKRDDGAAVYLNGTEVLRTSNLAASATYNTLANNGGAAEVNGFGEFTLQQIRLASSLLRAGRNVLAVEVHQQSLTSDDLSFDLHLRAIYKAAGLAGDLNGNGALDVGDLDQLSSAVRSQLTEARFDVNHDGQVNDRDRVTWVHDLRRTWIGDSNLDGVFDESDLVEAFQVGSYEDSVAGNSNWGAGDWDGDGDFTTLDFVTALSDGGYRAGPRQATAAVPEPAGCGVAGLALVTLLAARRCVR